MKTFLAIMLPLSVILSVCVYHPAEATVKSHTGSTTQQPGPLTLVRGGGHVGGGEFHEGLSGSRHQENQGQNRLENRETNRNNADFISNNEVMGGFGGGGFDAGGGASVDDDGEGVTNTSGCYYDNQGNLICNAN
ncbi:MAG: hypothetical protein KBD36_01960 [Alphaproteobacteria bacterium]|jgi:hypothetical protein|nr:hypothetical protein [Alphaproteobacteria bacterium]MBP9776598.1 hypothetical protein [Alphaproteobacteria bacterium]